LPETYNNRMRREAENGVVGATASLTLPAKPINFHHMTLRYAAWVAVLLALGHLCWLQLRPGSASRQNWSALTSRASGGGATHPPGSTADARDGGNVLLVRAGYARTNLATENALFYYYFHTTYALYPRRIFVAPADRIVIKGLHIMNTEFNPDRRWLEEHDVRYVATFSGSQTSEHLTPESMMPVDKYLSGAQTNQARGN
jgi:hypothetical protein